MDVVKSSALALGYQSIAKIVAGGYFTAGQVLLVVLVNIEGGLTILSLLDTVTVAIVDKGTGISAIGDLYWPIIIVPGEGLAAAGGHIAVGIVAIVGGTNGGNGWGLVP